MKRLSCAFLLFATLAARAGAPRPPFTTLYVFGDSYSDTGAGFQFADGPTAIAYLAERLGIALAVPGTPDFTRKSINFAVSGAPSGPGDARVQGLRAQVDRFAALVSSGQIHFNPSQTMFFLEGGLNDGRLPDGETVRNLEGEIDTLHQLGGRRFEVTLLPTAIPAFAAVGKRLNPQLAAIPADMRAKYKDIRIATSDWGPFFDRVLTHPADYGLTNTTDSCASLNRANPTPPCAEPAKYFYYYAAHPSTAAHKAVANMLYTEAAAQ